MAQTDVSENEAACVSVVVNFTPDELRLINEVRDRQLVEWIIDACVTQVVVKRKIQVEPS